MSTREEISDLLSLEGYIDLVIPRGSTQLVRTIQDQSHHIPVMGHAEGICHVYVDNDADLTKALKIGECRCNLTSAVRPPPGFRDFFFPKFEQLQDFYVRKMAWSVNAVIH